MLDNPAQFALAGNATFTLLSQKTGTRFTYKIKVAEDNATLHFVSLLVGPDNQTDYRYIGFLRRGVFFHGGAKAKIKADAPSVLAFNYFWTNTMRGVAMPMLEVSHAGRCGVCARLLTEPESIKTGFGPICREKMGV